MKSLLVLCYLLCVAIVSGADLDVSDWIVPESEQTNYPDMVADVGDTMIFSWPEGVITDVFIHPTGTCEEDEAILVGYTSGSSYTFQDEDIGKELFFAADVGRRCEAGQNVKVSVSAANVQKSVDSAAQDATISGRRWISSSMVLAGGFFATMLSL